MRKQIALGCVVTATLFSSASRAQEASEPSIAELVARLGALEDANARLTAEVERLRQAQEHSSTPPMPQAPTAATARAAAQPVRAAAPGTATSLPAAATNSASGPALGIAPAYGYALLDHAENINRRQILQLEARRDGELDAMVTLSGAVTAIADAQWSNTTNKFGYLMRHPTGSNERTRATQEIVLHSAQLAFTVAPTRGITAYAEMLYDPEQSFGAGTITTLSRNQVQLRKAWVMAGDLSRSPLYAAIGKMDVPFGLQDTVSPFTNSTNWHAFAPLAYGGLAGYYDKGLSLRAMAIVGGSQFRGANTSVDGTNVPSKVNNFALDASYTLNLAPTTQLRLGGSYLHGTAYCQSYPVFHFNPCEGRNPAWGIYGKLDAGRLHLIGDFARTIRVLPGTQVPDAVNPDLAHYSASRISSLTLGARYNLPVSVRETNVSFEFSRFNSGPDGAPWERQEQWVAGLSHRLADSVDLFGEYVHTVGYVPLNFLSGGNFPDGSTWSVHSARSNVLVTGVQAAF
ncbi:hypothetical protein [Novosphingobium decolorationis]|uniref:Porin n=1 Tax=Novosphingobium decolorationis TaxID=2698673 RepID=A0ABX8E8G9_9SPHN|nr:hypothetical protein [Novosphingobium decolorationis]QVM85485.1 hypothetical protein HT578_18845 [Novosphingobium decolorationis]